jgi:possible hydrolase
MYAEDWFTEIAGDAMGIIFQAEGEKTVYFVGDTIWTADVNKALNHFKPEIIVMNTGAARALAFKEPIIMGKEDVEHMVKAMSNSQIVAVHLDSVNHATVTRKDLREFIKAKNIEKNVIVPEDGEIIKFKKNN